MALTVCDTCGTFFDVSIFSMDNTSTVEIKNCTAGTCPNCGNIGHILDVVYKGIGNAISIIATSEKSQRELEEFKAWLAKQKENIINKTVDKNELETGLRKFGLDWFIPKKISDLLAYISAIIAIIGLLKSCDRNPTQITHNNIYKQMLIEQKAESKNVNINYGTQIIINRNNK